MMPIEKSKKNGNENATSGSETIVALATASGRSGIGVVRLSGVNAFTIASQIIQQSLKPRYAHFCSFYDEQSRVIDQGLALFFPAPHSFTGESVVELQAHGSPVVLDQLIVRCVELGARLARAGEFSERAFLNDKMDLVQAEAIADLINASTEQAAKSAMRSLQGEFSKKINNLANQLIDLRKWIEACIDFPDEEVDFLQDAKIDAKLCSLQKILQAIIQSAKQGILLQQGLQVAIIGKPNVGKSSLLNFLSGRDSAIVTAIPGTTRDLVKETISLDGLPLHIIDTAGLRDTNDVVEKIGIDRSMQVLNQADLVFIYS